MFEYLLPEISKHLLACYPDEGCGLIVRSRCRARFEYIPCKNILSPELRTQNFKIETLILERYANRLKAVVHSHQNGQAWPSKFDMERQIETDVTWGIGAIKNKKIDFIWFGGDLEIKQLLGRPFRHGVTDCFSLIRDWYHIYFNVTLDNIPREWEWWRRGDVPGLIVENFSRLGFRSLAPGESPRFGDIACISVRSKTPHHCAIYINRTRMLHHPGAELAYDPARISGYAELFRWRKYIKFWLRYTKNIAISNTVCG